MSLDISLTAGMRNNLLSLQQTAKLQSQTQERLASGKKVNSALDNPTNFFAAQSANNRANDLTSRKDGMSEAVQMVKAADAGITGITALIESAKGVAQAALATTSSTDRSAYATTFNTLMTQVSQLASDSGYRGTNLLTNASQTVEFAPTTNAATLNIQGFTATANGLCIGGVTSVAVGTMAGVSAASSAGTAVAWVTSADGSTAATDTTKIQSSATQLETALTTLRSQSSSLSANLSVVTTRQAFTDNIINTLQTGADNLTLADMNKEGANTLMLQTRQSLGTTSLSMASQAAQSVLKLF